jgi:hypothetical protein
MIPGTLNPKTLKDPETLTPLNPKTLNAAGACAHSMKPGTLNPKTPKDPETLTPLNPKTLNAAGACAPSTLTVSAPEQPTHSEYPHQIQPARALTDRS